MLSFIGKSETEGINYSSIARNCGITRYKAEQYVNLLEKAFILHQVFPKGTNVLKEPKILMSLPYRLLYTEFKENLGALREDFFVEMMRMADEKIGRLLSKSRIKVGDIKDYLSEIPVDSELPWDFIDHGYKKERLIKEYEHLYSVE